MIPMKNRHVYLKLKTLHEAREIFARAFHHVSEKSESVPLSLALDRITAAPVFARFSSPNYHAAAMDGVAVKAETTYGASPQEPRTLTLGDDAVYVNTGQVLPEGMDAVIMVEQLQALSEDKVTIEAAAYPWQHVRKVGEDIVATEMILPQGCGLGPYELGALAAGGVFDVPVKRLPKVAVLPTGSELILPAEVPPEGPSAGQVIEFNSVILSALIRRAGGEPVVLDSVTDDRQAVAEALRRATAEDHDLIIVNAGSSAGSEDYTAAAVAELGEVLVHGVTIMPGKPTILGQINGKPIIGNPGYPVSAVISFEQFAQPYLARFLGQSPPQRPEVEAASSNALPSKLGLEEFLRVKLGYVHDRFVAAPLPRGAGAVTTLTRADGVIRVPVESEGVGAEETVRVELIRPLEDVEGNIIVIGSHDNTLDLLNDHLRRFYPRFSLSSSNVGSLGGLAALRRRDAHLAGSHLLDEETGEYNIGYIQKYLPNTPVRLVNLVHRQQGLITAKGNPKGITGVEDLARDDVTYINRQAGAGTRVLLDHYLKKTGLRPEDINGYENEEFTHMAAAVAVLSGRADAGMAIYAAAKALNLDFIPVTTERYDLVIPESVWHEGKVQALLSVMRTDGFKNAVLDLGGYLVDNTGDVIWSSNPK
jgi:putative molybdopterin biosynthesis protein